MPVSPAIAEDLADAVVVHYAEAERVLLARIARALDRGLEAPHWAEKKLLEAQFLRAQTARYVKELGGKGASAAAVSIAEAYNRGGAMAAADLAALLKVGLEEVSGPLAGLPAVEALVSETVAKLKSVETRILRWQDDVYRSVVAKTAGTVLTGSQTMREACQDALNRFAAKGVTGFVDKNGTGWTLPSYVEGAMRTACGRAAVQGHVDRLQAHGFDLVIVSDAPRECHLCRPWEGKVLSLSGLESLREETPDATPPTLEEQTAEAKTTQAGEHVPTLDDFAAELGEIPPEGKAIGAIDVRTYRTGSTDSGLVFLAGNRADAEDYIDFHAEAPVVEYQASLKNAYALQSYRDLYRKLAPGKPAKSQIQAQKLVYGWLKKQGYDGVVVMVPNALTTKVSRELVVFSKNVLRALT